ncbi:MAG TPA: GNAT family N-acetyltransferase [Methylibium sp.]|nr:GNAT family N-acetyltransferase [Methylibium sp.]
MKALDAEDRRLRFGHAVGDAQIDAYVNSIDFDRDEVFGVFNRRLELVAMAHLAYAAAPEGGWRPAMVEFGVSVLSVARGRGYGARLFERAIVHARNRGTDKLLIHALAENQAMLHIARQAGATVRRDGPEAQAWLQLPPDTLGSQLEELVESHAAEASYQLRRHALQLEQILEAVGEARRRLGASPPSDP